MVARARLTAIDVSLSHAVGEDAAPPFAIAATTLTPIYARSHGGLCLADCVRGLGYAKLTQFLSLPRFAGCLKSTMDASKNQLMASLK